MSKCFTKSINELQFNENDKFFVKERKSFYTKEKKRQTDLMIEKYQALCDELADLEKREFICDTKDQIVYCIKKNIIIPHPKCFDALKKAAHSNAGKINLDFCGIKGRAMKYGEAESLFSISSHKYGEESYSSELGKFFKKNGASTIRCCDGSYSIPRG